MGRGLNGNGERVVGLSDLGSWDSRDGSCPHVALDGVTGPVGRWLVVVDDCAWRRAGKQSMDSVGQDVRWPIYVSTPSLGQSPSNRTGRQSISRRSRTVRAGTAIHL